MIRHQFQNILIDNIDGIVSHAAGADLIKLSFRKLCKSSLYNIVQVIDAKNYKQLSKKLIPIIRNRQNDGSAPMNKNKHTTINSMTTNIILSTATIPPPPPKKKVNKKHKLSGTDIMYPPRKKQKLKIPVDPRLIRATKPIKIVYKRRKSADSMMVLEWNVNADLIAKNVQTCVDKVMAPDALQDVAGMLKSCTNDYGFGDYLNGLDYYALFDVMQIVLQIPVVDLNGDRTKIVEQLRSVCAEEAVLFVKKESVCVCSPRLGMVGDVQFTLEEFMNEKHFKSIYDGWKSKGTTKVNSNHEWLNAFVVYLYLALDICRIELKQIRKQYLNDLMNVSMSMQRSGGALPNRVLYHLLAEMKKADQNNKMQKIKPNFCGLEVTATNGL